MSARMLNSQRKIVVVGAGAVGSTFSYALAQSGLADEIVLIDQNRELMEGQVLDLAHGFPYFPPVKINCGDKNDYQDAKVIVITAGASQKPGESRLQLLKRNVIIMESIIDDIVKTNSKAILVVVTNPVDILTYVAIKRSGWKSRRVIGSGTVLDSARFRYILSKYCQVDVRNVHAYILGEHGDSEFAAWSMSHIAGVPIDIYFKGRKSQKDWQQVRSQMEEKVRNSAYHIIDYKGATYYAIGLALVQIVGAIIRNQRSIMTVSTLLNGEYDLQDICLGVPTIVTSQGVDEIIEGKLTTLEKKALTNSAKIIKSAINELGIS